MFVHVILDGRDAIFNSGIDFVKKLQDKMKEVKVGKIASVSGRFYAMDRDNRWDRTEKAYSAIACGIADAYFTDPLEAIKASYDKKIYDEEFAPTVIGKKINQRLLLDLMMPSFSLIIVQTGRVR